MVSVVLHEMKPIVPLILLGKSTLGSPRAFTVTHFVGCEKCTIVAFGARAQATGDGKGSSKFNRRLLKMPQERCAI